MIRSLVITVAAVLPMLHADHPPDLLRFTNGDQLHGSFQGIAEGPSLVWKRQDLDEIAKFGVNNLRHLVMRGGNPAVPLKSISLVELVNGDQIPGMVTALNDKEITIETSCAGSLTLERNKVARIAPQPLGGRLHYHGPFSPEHWEVTSYNRDEKQHQEQAKAEDEAPDEKAEAEDKQPAAAPWQHSGAAWYWKSAKPGTALILRNTIPRKSTLRFDIAWKNQLNLAIALHADFCVKQSPKQEDDDGKPEDKQRQRDPFVAHDSSCLPSIFGNAFILQIHSNYMVIYRTMVDAEGNESVKRVQTASNRLNIGENTTSTFELRSDLDNSSYSLFLNDKFIIQWTDPALRNENTKTISGNSLAFLPQIADAQIKISDVIIAEWNGMPDSARSLQVDDQDIILMTNGLDRLAGQAISLEENNTLRFRGKHGEFLLPLDEISELHMANGKRLDFEPPSGLQLKLRFSPMGMISGAPLSGDRKTLVLDHPLAGDMTIHNESVVMYEFNDSTDIFTDWDENF